MIKLKEEDKKLLEEIQKDFPVDSRPYNTIGLKCGIREHDVIEKINNFTTAEIIREISAIFNAKKLGYKSTLIAATITKDAIESAVNKINSNPGVSHNYLRNHSYNVWFTLTIKKEKDFKKEIDRLLNNCRVEQYLILPSIRTFKIGVNFKFTEREADYKYEHPAKPDQRLKFSQSDKELITYLQNSFPVIPQPWSEIAHSLKIPEGDLINSISSLKTAGIIKRISAVLRHRKAGFTANGMACFNIPEENIIQAGEKIAQFPEVSHCYQRPTFPDWNYSLFAMVHAVSKNDCEKIIETISEEIKSRNYTVLYSSKEFKKERVKYFME